MSGNKSPTLMLKIKDYIKSYILYLIISPLIFSGIFVKSNPFFNVGVALIWCWIILALVIFFINIIIIMLRREDLNEELIKYAKNFKDKTKSINWLNRILLVINFLILAYCGWIITSIIYLISMLTVKLSISLVKEKVNET